MKMNMKEFYNYDEACEFCKKVGGQIQWTDYKDIKIWYVWYIC